MEQPLPQCWSTNSVPRAFFPRAAIGCGLSLKIDRNLSPSLAGGGLIRSYMIWYDVNRRYGIWRIFIPICDVNLYCIYPTCAETCHVDDDAPVDDADDWMWMKNSQRQQLPQPMTIQRALWQHTAEAVISVCGSMISCYFLQSKIAVDQAFNQTSRRRSDNWWGLEEKWPEPFVRRLLLYILKIVSQLLIDLLFIVFIATQPVCN